MEIAQTSAVLEFHIWFRWLFNSCVFHCDVLTM